MILTITTQKNPFILNEDKKSAQNQLEVAIDKDPLVWGWKYSQIMMPNVLDDSILTGGPSEEIKNEPKPMTNEECKRGALIVMWVIVEAGGIQDEKDDEEVDALEL